MGEERLETLHEPSRSRIDLMNDAPLSETDVGQQPSAGKTGKSWNDLNDIGQEQASIK